MIAVTIGIGEYYKRLAIRASEAVRNMTALETVILDDTHFVSSGLPYPHLLKLRVFDVVDDDKVMFFDSDMVCLNVWNPQRFARRDAIVAVAERLYHMVIRACLGLDIHIHAYLDAGLMR